VKEGENNGKEGRNDDKGLQCREFLTWKVGNPDTVDKSLLPKREMIKSIKSVQIHVDKGNSGHWTA